MGAFDPQPNYGVMDTGSYLKSALDQPLRNYGTENLATTLMSNPLTFSLGTGLRLFAGSQTDTAVEAAAGGFEHSFGAGAVMRDMLTPAGNTKPDPILSNLPFGVGPSYMAMRAAANAFRPHEASMTPDQYKASPYFRTGIPYDPGMTEDRAAALAHQFDGDKVREFNASNAPLAATIGGFVGQAADPINYIPVFGEGAQAALAARFGFGFMGRLAAAGIEGSAGAALNTAAFGGLTASLRGKFGDDVSWQAYLNEIGQGAIAGAAFGAIGGALGESLRGVSAGSRALADLIARDKATTAATAQAGRSITGEAVGQMANGELPSLSPRNMDAVQRLADDVASRTAGVRSLQAETSHLDAAPVDMAAKGGERVAITPAGSRVLVRPEVVDIGTLTHAADALQVRDRGSAESQKWVEQTAAKLDPAQLMPETSADRGAPIVGSDGTIDSGNGRIMAIRRAAEAYPEKYAAYKDALRAAGYNVPDTGTPVLISRRVTDLSPDARAQFNTEANAPVAVPLTPVEKATMDRAALDPPTLDLLDPTAPSLNSPKNDAFVSRFLQNLTPNERGPLIGADKKLNADGVRRIENALVAKAYGDVDEAVVRRFSEATDDNTRTVVGAMSDVSGRWAQMREHFKRGDVDATIDPTPALTDALRFLSQWREQAASEGRAVSTVIREGMAQMDMLGGGASIEARAAIRAMYQNDHFAKAVGRDVLAARLGLVLEETTAISSPNIFDDANVGVLEIYNAAIASGQGNLFEGASLEPRAEGVGTGGVGNPAGADRGLNRPAAEAGAGPDGGGPATGLGDTGGAGGSSGGGGEQSLSGGDRPQSAAATEGTVNGEVRGSAGRGEGVSAVPQPEVPGDAGGREEDGSLRGLPRKAGDFQASVYPEGVSVAQRYMAASGLPYDPPNTYVKVDKERAKRVADAFDAMVHDPSNPDVASAYQAMINETLSQYQAMLDDGMKIEFIPKGTDPYNGNPRNMTEDVRTNKHMWVFSTDDGFGSDEAANVADNPLLGETKFQISGRVARANDIFRAVHDYFGHVKEGVGFRADGEENAWRSHSAMYSPEARRAMTSETRGQNSWVNFGPYGETNRTANQGDTHYADQKIGLLPDWVITEGAHDPKPGFDDVKDVIATADKALKGAAGHAVDEFIGHPATPGDETGIMLAHKMEAIARGEDPKGAAELEQAFAPVREALRAKLGDTVTLYRVQRPVVHDPNVRSGSVPNDGRRAALSWTMDPKFADSYGGVRRPQKLYSEERIATLERQFAEKGSIKVGSYELRKGTTGSEIDLYHQGEHLTDADSVREFIEGHNEDLKAFNARALARQLPVLKAVVPLNDVLWATDRANQQEFIVKNWPASPHFIDEAGKLKEGAHVAAKPPAVEELRRPMHEIINPINPEHPPEEKLAQIAALTQQNVPLLTAITDRIDRELGTESKVNVKRPETIAEKAKRPSIVAKKPWHDMEHIRDTLRFKTVISNLNQVEPAFDMLAKQGVSIVKIDTGKLFEPKEWGWRIIAFDLRMPNGQLVEWYLPLKELEEAKGAGHLIFEKWRDKTPDEIKAQMPEYEADIRKSFDGYDSAFKAALDRMGLSEAEARASWSKSEAALPEIAEKSASSSGMMGSALDEGSHVPADRINPGPSSGITQTRSNPPVSLSTRNIASDIGSRRPVVDASPPRPDPVPEGLAAAEASVGKDETIKQIADEHGIGLTDGAYDEKPEVDQLRKQGRISAGDEAALQEADTLYAQAEAFGNTIKAAAACML